MRTDNVSVWKGECKELLACILWNGKPTAGGCGATGNCFSKVDISVRPRAWSSFPLLFIFDANVQTFTLAEQIKSDL